MKTEDTKALAESALETLAAQLESGQSAALTTYLTTMARFHRYSINNVLLIQAQRPGATHVAGFATWRQLGRFVRRGEKGIAILVPIAYRRHNIDADRELERSDRDPVRTIVGFKAGYVFDISQTDGKPLPVLTEVSGDPADFAMQLKAFANSRGIEVGYGNGELGSADGASFGGRIVLRDDLSPAVEFAVLVHEVAHELLHRGDRRAATSKKVRETEAEAVAFIVSQAIGLETNTAASDYIQLYAGSKETLLASLETIRATSVVLLDALVEDRRIRPWLALRTA
jgi:antirestriction protein ArdC